MTAMAATASQRIIVSATTRIVIGSPPSHATRVSRQAPAPSRKLAGFSTELWNSRRTWATFCEPAPDHGRVALVRHSPAFFRSNSHTAKHRTCTWYLSSPGTLPSWANWISSSSSVLETGSSHTEQAAPTPFPPQIRSGGRGGNFPFLTASRAFSRARLSDFTRNFAAA